MTNDNSGIAAAAGINTGGPAFPTIAPDGFGQYGSVGMTLRDYAAIEAMHGLLASGSHVIGYRYDECDNPSEHDIAKKSYQMADAMLEARGK